MANSKKIIPGTNRSHKEDSDNEMEYKKNTRMPKAEIRRRNGDQSKISNPQ
ncbi:hypothetical protein [Clostridium thermarum]|uniref:hypothetical protein n=1 Tax=Clostridium thermarum TaxID=1716543 RepID=UPI0013D20F93|nr:hypothetical protein [Clostridium thermarum]